ncbi:MAG: electron transfer flavoprotein subunit alpha/FixB family protein [Candidatus Krumholzibacteriia bacterium]
MPNIAVFIEQRAGQIKTVSWQMLSAARALVDQQGGEVWGVHLHAAGCQVQDQAGQHGAHKVFTAEAPAFATYDSELWTQALAAFTREHKPDVLLIGSTAMGKDLAPRLAARLDCACVSDAVGLSWDGGLVVKRPVFAGKCFAEVTSTAPLTVVGIRPNAFAQEAVGGTAEALALTPALDAAAARARVTSEETGSAGKVSLTEAEVVVSGGRGIKGPENYVLIEQLAEAFGAAAGASRAIVDAGWVDYSHQVGQTGKTVAPNLYVACGISGAIQHLAGMSSSKCIVAINKDENAPIFKVADYGIAGDLFQIVPALTEAVKELRG